MHTIAIIICLVHLSVLLVIQSKAVQYITSTPVVRTDVYLHMPIAVTASSGQFVTRASWLPGQFVVPG